MYLDPSAHASKGRRRADRKRVQKRARRIENVRAEEARALIGQRVRTAAQFPWSYRGRTYSGHRVYTVLDVSPDGKTLLAEDDQGRLTEVALSSIDLTQELINLMHERTRT